MVGCELATLNVRCPADNEFDFRSLWVRRVSQALIDRPLLRSCGDAHAAVLAPRLELPPGFLGPHARQRLGFQRLLVSEFQATWFMRVLFDITRGWGLRRNGEFGIRSAEF
jgi:hypothetical protein